ncbi:MAG: abortive infection system antitoxin AbiGi family protein [Gaiellales bacterium]
MAENIVDLLQRRGDLSTFLLHFTTTRENLLSILTDHRVEARSAWGMLRAKVEQNPALAETQRCVCFTEAPLEHAWMMCREIEGRTHQFGPYGIAFSKVWARREGANPVWYVDITPTHDWLMVPLNDLVALAENGHARTVPRDGAGRIIRPIQPQVAALETCQVARLAPFIEQMGTGAGAAYSYHKEFWWEREWRKVGHMYFRWANAVSVFLPEDEHTLFARELAGLRQGGEEPPPLLDPRWGLERMIAALRGLSAGDVGPFP